MSVTCTYHCSPCSLHFHSLEAFDAHRVGSYAEGRHCEHPFDLLDKHGEPILVPLSEDGVCRLGCNTLRPLTGITVWVMARAAGRAAKALGAPGQALSGVSVATGVGS